jgi:glycosyltransferase involved in cell wall biosynthesis
MYFKKEAAKIAQYEKNICNSCDLNLVVSELDASRLKEIAGDVKVSVIPNGVDLEYFRASNLDSKNTRGIIFAGGMAYYANREAAHFFVSDYGRF